MLAATGIASVCIRLICIDGEGVTLVAQGCAAAGRCPSCGQSSAVVHDRYTRRPRDLPWRGHVVRWRLLVRRFRCTNRACRRLTFAEDFGPVLPRRAQRTAATAELLANVALALGGEAGARLARRAGVVVSPDTLLRLLRRLTDATVPTPRVLGIDDLALRRGMRYATIFLDLETHRPVDLVAGRDADTVAAWLLAHPGVEVVVRDRAEAYAEGARRGAPGALQVADRFHLVQNASGAMDELLRGRRRRVQLAPVSPAPGLELPPPARAEERGPSAMQHRAAARRAARVARWRQVQDLFSIGVSVSGIARAVEIDRKTVRRLLVTPDPPRNHIVHPRPSGLTSPTLQPYVPYLQDRWQQGCQNISRLYREIAAQGYDGSRSLVARSLLPWRQARPPPGDRRRHRHAAVRRLCLRPPEQLGSLEQEALARVLTDDAELARGHALLQRFRAVIATRAVAELDQWLAEARTSGLPPFRALATGIEADRGPVDAALRLPWSTGPVEGQICRVKLIKRQGYGRAKLDLLRRRMLGL
jgi:transposase